MENMYRELRLMNGYREDIALFQLYSDDVPERIDYDGHEYRQGQWSGPSGRLVWFERI
jgi:hypothetical protein